MAEQATIVEDEGAMLAHLEVSDELRAAFDVDPYGTAMMWMRFIAAEALKHDGAMNEHEHTKLTAMYRETRTNH